MRQKETKGQGQQNNDQTSNAVWGRNVGYNEAAKKSDWCEHLMGSGRKHIEESVEDGYTREKEGRTIENKIERNVPM